MYSTLDANVMQADDGKELLVTRDVLPAVSHSDSGRRFGGPSPSQAE